MSQVIHKMPYIFADPSQIEVRVKNGYLRGRQITRLIDKINLNNSKLVYDKLNDKWIVGGSIINLNRKSILPFCLRRWFHARKMWNQIKKDRFDAKVALIKKAYLQEASKSVVESSKKSIEVAPLQITALKQDLDALEVRIQASKEKVAAQPTTEETQKEIDQLQIYIQQLTGLKDSIYFEERYFTTEAEKFLIADIEKKFPSAVGKLDTKTTIQEVIDELIVKQEEIEHKRLEQNRITEDLKASLDILLEERQRMEDSINEISIQNSEDPEVTFIQDLRAWGGEDFYLNLGEEHRKVYKAICQPDVGGPLFTLAAEFFILGMKKLKAKLVQDSENPHCYMITALPRKGKCLFKEPILKLEGFNIEIPNQMMIEYKPEEKKWFLIKGPKLVVPTRFHDFTMDVVGMSMSSVQGKIKVHYRLPFFLKPLQAEVDDNIIYTSNDILTNFKDNNMVVWSD